MNNNQTTINTINSIGKEIIEIWNEYKERKFCEYNPILPATIKTNGLLFVGLNPSIRKNCSPNEYDGNLDSYGFPPATDGYFGKFWRIAERTGFNENWSHFDLLFFRGFQTYVKEVMKDKITNGDIFIAKQLELSRKLLEQSQPQLIVICNKLAVEFTGKNRKVIKGITYGEWLDLKPEIINNHHTIKGIPIIFSKQPNRFFSNIEMEELITQIIDLKKIYNID